MKYSTGRGTRIKHSTAMEWDEYEKKKRHSRVRYSTGKGTALRHSCGVLLDGEIPEQENHPDREPASVEEKNDLKEKGRKGFKRIVADY
ncbi:MAG: hypothetical protein ABIL06_01905 [Pseudomonadota bacterium]